MSRQFVICLACFCALPDGMIVPRECSSSEPTTRNAKLDDESLQRRVVGTWQDNYQGKRTMTLRKDGSGVMVVVLDGWRATLFASRLEFEMVWSVRDGRLKKQTLRGKPEDKVKWILKAMGDRVDEPILEATEDRLLLLDGDGKTRYDWRRAKPGVGNDG